jgi:hypothetical protein
MSDASPLHPVVLREFTTAFGPPHRTLGKDMHWGLRPTPTLAAINILVNGSSDHPVLWLFDPHHHDPLNPNDGVHNEVVRTEADITRLVALITQRVAAAGGAR